jgi:hypothetical protein
VCFTAAWTFWFRCSSILNTLDSKKSMPHLIVLLSGLNLVEFLHNL